MHPVGLPAIAWMAPRSTSSIPGWPAAVTDTESPSQLMPSEIQRMWTSSTPAGASSTAMRDRLLRLQIKGLDSQLLAGGQGDVPAAASPAGERERVERALRPAGAAAPGRRHLLEHELGAVEQGALRDQLEGERQRLRHDLAQ